MTSPIVQSSRWTCLTRLSAIPAGSTLTVHAILGLLYILHRADSLKAP
jgi:hypothetical protein